MASRRDSTTRGFKAASALVRGPLEKATGKRGFAVARLLTHWEEVAGPDMARMARPVEISHARGGLGATLTLLTTGACAPLVEMGREPLRERVNAVYGYNAIRRIRITQTAPAGFAEAQAGFAGPGPRAGAHGEKGAGPPPAEVREKARALTRDIADPGLKAALETLATHVISRHGRKDAG